MTDLTPEQRETLKGFLAEAEQIERFEFHFRRTDRLYSLSLILVTALATVIAVTQGGVVAAMATGTLFPLGLMFGATWISVRQRRRSYEQVANMREIAELYLLYDESGDD